VFTNELDENGNPICTACGKSVMPNGTLPVDSLDRGTGAFTASGGIAIIHKSCAKELGL
jgi:hypothetical protein